MNLERLGVVLFAAYVLTILFVLGAPWLLERFLVLCLGVVAVAGVLWVYLGKNKRG